MESLRKVDFYWINRDQKSFEWFLNLLGEIENEQNETLQKSRGTIFYVHCLQKSLPDVLCMI